MVIVPRCAVLLIDLQRDFLDLERGRMPVSEVGAKAVLRVANDVLSLRILVGAMPILVVNEFPRAARLANFFRKGAAIVGSAGAELDRRVERSGSEQIFTKARPSAFSNPQLERCLRANGVQDIYVLGVFAEGCVRATAIEAVKRGYTVHVIADAVASNAAWKKAFALRAMARAGAEILSSVVATAAATERPTAANLVSNAVGSATGKRMGKVCIVGASGKLGQYMVRHALALGYEVVGVCREGSVAKLDTFKGRITVVPGATNDREIIRKAVAGCDGVLTVLVPWGVHQYASGTAQAVLDQADQGARLIFSCGWHITRDGQDVYSRTFKALVNTFTWLARLFRVAELDDQVEACRRVFASDTRWTVVRGSKLEEGDSQGLPVWSRHVGDPILAGNLTRRVDFALFMVAALDNDELIREAPAIVGRNE